MFCDFIKSFENNTISKTLIDINRIVKDEKLNLFKISDEELIQKIKKYKEKDNLVKFPKYLHKQEVYFIENNKVHNFIIDKIVINNYFSKITNNDVFIVNYYDKDDVVKSEKELFESKEELFKSL